MAGTSSDSRSQEWLIRLCGTVYGWRDAKRRTLRECYPQDSLKTPERVHCHLATNGADCQINGLEGINGNECGAWLTEPQRGSRLRSASCKLHSRLGHI